MFSMEDIYHLCFIVGSRLRYLNLTLFSLEIKKKICKEDEEDSQEVKEDGPFSCRKDVLIVIC